MSQHVEDRICAYLDDELSDTETAELRAHVQTCKQCSERLREMQGVVDVLEGDEALRPLDSMWPEVEAGLRRRLPVFDLPFAAATAAALAIGVMLGVLTFDRQVLDTQPVAEVAAATDEWSTDSELLLSDIYMSDPGTETNSQ